MNRTNNIDYLRPGNMDRPIPMNEQNGSETPEFRDSFEQSCQSVSSIKCILNSFTGQVQLPGRFKS